MAGLDMVTGYPNAAACCPGRAEAPGENISGAESYQRYAERMRKIVEGVGGRFIWSGRVDSQVIGRSDVRFDVVEGQWLLATTAASSVR